MERETIISHISKPRKNHITGYETEEFLVQEIRGEKIVNAYWSTRLTENHWRKHRLFINEIFNGEYNRRTLDKWSIILSN